MASMGLPHWLMIAGTLLVLFGLSGFALSRNKAVETDTAFLPGDVGAAQPAEGTEEMKSER
jgi:hypothetical protein